jgi:hypothetical protein
MNTIAIAAIQDLAQIKILDEVNVVRFLEAWQIGKRVRLDDQDCKDVVAALMG